MANYTSKHTGVEIDATVSSGSTTSGVIKDFTTLSGSSTATIKVGGDITANDLIVNQITASGNISSSGTLTVGTFTPSSISTGNITSSNNISASGNLYLTGDLDLDGKSHFKGNITASGNISSSGTITAGALTLSNISTGNITASAHISGSSTSTITIGGTIEAGGNISSSGDLIVGGNDIFGSAGVKRLTFGATNVFNGHVSSSGAITASNLASVNEIFLKDGTLDGDTLVRIYDSSDDGIIDVYQNNSVKNRIHGNGLSYIQGGDFVIGANISASNAKLTVRGNISSSGNITASQKIISQDEFILKDGTLGGDTLVRQYASGDDGIVDVYQNNAVKTRLHGSGVSYFQGGNVGIGTTSPSALLHVAGHITASGITGSKIASTDEILLKDTRLSGDTLVRAWASGDDGVIDVYRNNSVALRLGGTAQHSGTATGGGFISASTYVYTNQITASGNATIGTTKGSGRTLTVAGDISASGDVIANRYIVNSTVSTITSSFSSGSTIFGDSLDDTHKFTGSLAGTSSAGNYFTVKGDISASGDLYVNRIMSTGSAGAYTTFESNISASGDVYAEDYFINGVQFTDAAAAENTFGIGTLGQGSLNLKNIYAGGHITSSGNISASGFLEIDDYIQTDSHITASGNISGSFTSTGSFGRTSTTTLDLASIQGNWTNAGNTVADLGTITTIDINGGTINGITDLAVADGGTGVSTLTDGGVLLGNGTGGIVAMAVLTDGQMIVGDGTTDPVPESGATLRTSIGVGSANNVIFNHITASGNISASGNILTNGNITAIGTITAEQITSTDDMNVTDDLTVDGNITQSSTSTGSFQYATVRDRLGVGTVTPDYDLDVAGTVGVGNYIYHNGDADTYIRYQADKFDLVVGAAEMIFAVEGAGGAQADKVTINNALADVDFQVKGDNQTNLIRTDAANDKVGICTPSASSAQLTVEGDISASGVIEGLNRTKVLSATANLPLQVSSSGAIVVPSGGARTITLPPVAISAGVSFEIRAGSAHQHIVSQSGPDGNKRIYGHVIDNANASSAAGAGGTVIAASHKITLNSNNQIGDKLTFVGDGTNWYIDGICKDGPTAAT